MLCIYHKNCADGFGAAYAVWKKFGNNCRYYPSGYGDPLPSIIPGEIIVIVDFSYPADILEAMLKISQAGSILVIDHHKTAKNNLEKFPIVPSYEDIRELNTNYTPFGYFTENFVGQIGCVFDMNQSGAMLTYKFFHPNTPIPQLIEHIQDRDLWKFQLSFTKEIQANLFSYEYDFKIWDYIFRLTSNNQDEFDKFIESGKAILRKHEKDILELIEATKRRMVIAGVDVPVINVPYTMGSDACEILSKGEPFAAYYWDKSSGERAFGLRSQIKGGMDVSEIAKRYGGGGHKNAAGFIATKGWEGEKKECL